MNRAILVKSCIKHRERAETCGDTWSKALREAGVLVFVALQGQIPLIHSRGQFIHTTVGDRYSDNSEKLKQALAMLLLRYDDIEQVFICDDDTFMHPERWLAHEPQGDFEGRLYHPKPDEVRQHGSAPWINGGAGWWMSRRMCELYVQHCSERTSGDDIVVARIAQAHGIEIIDRPDLYGDSRYSDAPEVAAGNDLITCHPVAPAEMERLWSQLQGC